MKKSYPILFLDALCVNSRHDGRNINKALCVALAINSTNAIEPLNFSLRKVTRNKLSFPDDDSIYKVMYLAIKNASTRWTISIKDWGLGS